ncbi:hypothetical protein EXIGLDRAFT_364875 [Exidia glandulosa HHB12029]|uniref:Xylosidase/arabinosidase n=1 Tax=Exidia glandulosa HHB12029 TaxID=1314781 RepID=A0A165C3Z9_EXIGL|nr:hypothetical protein EXIGLDRAFT_364875 [Exidia glandulosa HHB12029]
MRTAGAHVLLSTLAVAFAAARDDVCHRVALDAPALEHQVCLLPPSALSKDFETMAGRRLRRADPTTIQDKVLVGYQGWFQSAGDGPPIHPGHHGWVHWFTAPLNSSIPNKRPNMDFWPDTTGYTDEELYTVPGLTYPDGSPAKLWSSRHPRTVRRHFHMMAEHGVDGAFLQRFTTHLEVDRNERGTQAELMTFRDEIGDRVREAAEAEDRVFAIMYDLSGLNPERLRHTIEVDWAHLMNDKKILESPNYLHEDGKPVIGIWGVGFAGSDQNPDDIAAIVEYLREVTPGGAYVMAGTPTHWASLTGDQDDDQRWIDVYYDYFDAISPWTVGRYDDEETADEYAQIKMKDDLESIKVNSFGRKVDFIPVVFPGMSSHYLSNQKDPMNWTKRDGGKFLWRQIYNARQTTVRTIYMAMWDEYDEGTALMPIVSSKRSLPRGADFIALDADGYDLPTDWYMRIAGLAADSLHRDQTLDETLPKKELDDYWARHPEYEPLSDTAEGSSSVAARTVVVTADETNDDNEAEAPPPPYSLEAEEPQVPQAPEARPYTATSSQDVNSGQPATPTDAHRQQDTLRRNHTVAATAAPTQDHGAPLRRNQTVGAQASGSSPLPSTAHTGEVPPQAPAQTAAPQARRDPSHDSPHAMPRPSPVEDSNVGGFVVPGSRSLSQSMPRPYPPRRPDSPLGGSSSFPSPVGYEHQTPPQQAYAPPPGPPPGVQRYESHAEVPRRPFPQQLPRADPSVVHYTYDPSLQQAVHSQAGQVRLEHTYEPYRPQHTAYPYQPQSFPVPHPAQGRGAEQHAVHPQPPLPPRPVPAPLIPGQYHDPGLRPYAGGWHPAAPQQGRPSQYSPGYVAHPSAGQQRPQQQQGFAVLDSAWNVVSRVAGQDRRRQLESLADSGAKIMGRFTGSRTSGL